jgi:hypothetical protein
VIEGRGRQQSTSTILWGAGQRKVSERHFVPAFCVEVRASRYETKTIGGSAIVGDDLDLETKARGKWNTRNQ